MPAPTFLGIGAMKCGTTTLYEYLKRHPDIFVPRRKEIDWFSRLSGTMTKGQYESLFPESFAVRGEFSPTYQNSVSEIAAVYPAMKLIFVVRDPIKKLISTARHATTYMPTFQFDADKALQNKGNILMAGCYQNTILKIREHAGLKLHVINFDDLVENQQQTFDALCEFLDAPYFETKPIHGFSSDKQRWPHEKVELTDGQINRLKEFYQPCNDFMQEHYGIAFKGL